MINKGKDNTEYHNWSNLLSMFPPANPKSLVITFHIWIPSNVRYLYVQNELTE